MLSTKVHCKQDIQDSINGSKEIISAFGVKSMGLFGSFVKNSVTDLSDVDLLVEFIPNKKSFDNFIELAFYLKDFSVEK